MVHNHAFIAELVVHIVKLVEESAALLLMPRAGISSTVSVGDDDSPYVVINFDTHHFDTHHRSAKVIINTAHVREGIANRGDVVYFASVGAWLAVGGDRPVHPTANVETSWMAPSPKVEA